MKDTKLKPCPFCGGKAKVKVCDGSGAFYTDIGTEMYLGRKMTHCLIRCERCRAKTQAYLTRRGVFNAWNRRQTMNDKQTKRTIFVGVFQYKDKEYTIHYDFGCGYPKESAEWMFLWGNYSCDCNRSLFIMNEYGDDAIPELDCGGEIELKEYHIEYWD